MSSITTRAGKGSPLTNTELDANFTNLNADKVEIGGDLSGTASAPTVAKIQGRAVASTAPSEGQALVWNATNNRYEPGTVAAGGGGGSGAYFVSSTPPGSPAAGDRWLDSDTGVEYTYFSDGNTSQWVELGNTGLDDTAYLPKTGIKGHSYSFYDSNTVSSLSYSNGSVQRWAPTGSVTLAITDWPSGGSLGELLIEGVNLGAASITWPTINWIKSDGSMTTSFGSSGVTLRSSGIDFILIWTRDGGTTLYGKVVR